MEEKNELNDIILNKGRSANNNKKIVLAVATLGVILIIVVMLMNSLSSNNSDNLPQAVLPPEPRVQAIPDAMDEPLFEDVEVIEEEMAYSDDLDQIAKKLKQESQEEEIIAPVITPKVEKKPKVIAPVKRQTYTRPVVKKETKTTPKKVGSKHYFVQVGSFAKYKPNKKFLRSITNRGYEYEYHKVVRNSKTINKVLVGPFINEYEARKALKIIRRNVEAGAFLTKL